MTDPRGPVRHIDSIELTPSAALLTLSCGHVSRCAPHFSYKTGNNSHCYSCGQQAKKAAQDGRDRTVEGLTP